MRKCFVGAVALFLLALIQSSAGAQTPTSVYELLIDLDQDSSTGCVSSPTGSAAFGGFERRLRATLDPDSQLVTALETQHCVDASFQNLVTLGAGQPAGLNNGVGGSDVLEFSVSINDLDPDGAVLVDLAFVADSGAGSDVLTAQDGATIGLGLPFLNTIPVPTLSVLALLVLTTLVIAVAWVAHQRAGQFALISLVALLATVAWAMNFVVDGQVADWTGISSIADDPIGDASNGSDLIDIRSAFIAVENEVLHARLDLTDIENQPPDTIDDTGSTDEDTELVTAAPGVLANDSDSNNDPITAVLATGPTNAANFSLNPDGSFTYTPEINFNGSDSFTYVANDGQADSALTTVTLTVNPVNDPPVASDDSASTFEDGPILIDVLSNDSDVDGNLDPASVTVTVGPSSGTAVPEPTTGGITYTKAGDFNGTDSFTYEVCDDGTPMPALCDTATVDVTVDSVNDAPSFVTGGNLSILEDAGAQTVPSWATAISAGPSDEAGQSLIFNVIANDNPALFGAAPSIDAASGDLSFTPADDANGTASITVTLSDDGGTANGGDDTSPPQTFNIVVTAVNDAPSFADGGNVSVLEDSGAYDQPWATTSVAGPPDESGQALSFSTIGNSNPTLFDVAPVIDATTGNLSFTPAANTEGSADITVELMDDGGTVNGGDDTSAAVTFTIAVADVNDAPNFTAGPDVNTPEDDGAQTVATWATAINDGDDGTQTLTFNLSNDNNALFSAQPAISPTGDLTFTSAADASGSALVTVTLSDDGGTANGGSDTSPPQSFTITIDPINDAPVFTAGADQTVLEDAGGQSLAGWATGIGDGDDGSQALTFNLSNDNNALFVVQPALDETGLLTFTPAANANGSAQVEVTLSDNGSNTPPNVNTSAAQTFTISVTAVNDAPSFTAGGDQIVSEDSGSLAIAGWAAPIDPGAANEAAQTLSFNITGNDNPSLFASGPVVSPSGELSFTPAANANGSVTITLELSDNGGTDNGGVDRSASQTFSIIIEPVNDAPSFSSGGDVSVEEDSGSYSQPWASAISAGPPNEAVQLVAFTITNNDNPGLFAAPPAIDTAGGLSFTPETGTVGTANLTVVLIDDGGRVNGGSDISPPVNFQISVLQINDPPSFGAGPDQTVNEDSGAQTFNGWATAISAGPPDEAGQTVSFNITGNANAALFSAGPSINSAGDLSFTPALDANGSAAITLVAQDDGGTANGGIDTSPPQSFTITVDPVNDPPQVTPPASYAVHSHVGRTFADGSTDLLDGATITDIDGPGSAPFSVAPASITSSNGGSATVSADGSFTYDPPAGFTGSDTFDYEICDSGVPAPSQCASVTATVVVSGPRVWFVDNSAAAGNGTVAAPFNTLAAAAAAADTNGDRIFIFTGSGNYSGNVTLQVDQRLIGQGVIDTDFDAALGITPPANSVPRPAINATRPTLASTVTLAGNAHARGFDINNTAANGISASSSSGLVVNQLSVTTTTGTAVTLANSSGALSFTRVSANGAANGIVINDFGGSFEITGDGSTAGSGGTIQNAIGNAVELINTGNVALNFLNIANGNANGVFGQNLTGLTLNGASLSNNGNGVNEGGLRFDPNLLGTVLIANSTITGSAEHNIEIINISGVLSDLTVSDSTIGSNSAALGADGLLLETRNAAEASVNVVNSTFANNRSDGIQISAIDSSVAALTVNGTTFTSSTDASPNGSVGARGIVVSAASSAELFFAIGDGASNDFSNFSPSIGEEAINATVLSTSTASALLSGRIINNTFLNSGGAVGVDVRGNGALVLEIDGNTGTTSRQSIDVIVGDAVTDAATADVTITDNALTVTGTAANPNNEAIGWLGDRNTTSCSNIRGNSAVASGTRDDIILDDFTNPAGAVNLESGPSDCGGACPTSGAHLLANNGITDALSGATIVAPGSCVTP